MHRNNKIKETIEIKKGAVSEDFTLIIIFGEMAMGKNFVGKLLAEEFGFYFYDGDEALVDGQKLRNKEDVDSFVKNQLIPEIEKQVNKNPKLVVSQALYFEEHRKMILDHFKENMPVRFIHVTASSVVQRERLLQRPEADSWLSYAARSHRRFEAPLSGSPLYSEIVNNKDKDEVIKQIKTLSYYPKSIAISEYKSNYQFSNIGLFPMKIEKLEKEKNLNLVLRHSEPSRSC